MSNVIGAVTVGQTIEANILLNRHRIWAQVEEAQYCVGLVESHGPGRGEVKAGQLILPCVV